MKYYFRGRVILDYNEDTKELTAPVDKATMIPNLNMCKLVTDDYLLLNLFIGRAGKHMRNEETTLEDIEVY